MSEQIPKQVQTALDNRRISGRFTLGNVLYFVKSLSEYDLGIEGKKNRHFKLMVAGFILTFISIFGGVIIVNIFDTPAVLFLVPLIILFAFFELVLFLRCRKKDLSNEFRQYFGPLINNLRDDIKNDAPLRLDIDFSSLDDKKYLKERGKDYSKGQYYKCFNELYQRDLMKLLMRLQDKNALVINASESMLKITKTKKTARKTKTKWAYKKSLIYDIRLYVNTDRYVCAEPAKETGIFKKEGRKGAVLCLKYKEKLTGEDSVPNPMLTLEKIVSLYALLKPAVPAAG